MKKLTFLMAILFAGVLVFGQNDAFIKQIDNGGILPSINVSQLGTDNLITGPATVVDADGVVQNAAYQNAGGSGWLGDGNKFAFGQKGDGNEGYIKQVSELKANFMWWCQVGDGNLMKVDQYSKHENTANQGQQLGDNNTFVGLTGAGYTCDYAENTAMVADITKYATQYDKYGLTSIKFTQSGDDNTVGLYQRNECCKTYFDLEQYGDDNTYIGYQWHDGAGPGQTTGMNLIDVYQAGGGGKMCKSFQRNTTGGGNNFVSMQL